MFLDKSDDEKRGIIFDDCILDGSPLTLMILQRHLFSSSETIDQFLETLEKRSELQEL
jgi:hypothetical protein